MDQRGNNEWRDLANGECPEESLGAIVQLVPLVKNGNMLLFTDDLPFDPATKKISALNALTVQVPDSVPANSVEKVWLTAMLASDGTEIAEDKAIIFTDDADSPQFEGSNTYLPLLRR